jgi:hypothetical protein
LYLNCIRYFIYGLGVVLSGAIAIVCYRKFLKLQRRYTEMARVVGTQGPETLGNVVTAALVVPTFVASLIISRVFWESSVGMLTTFLGFLAFSVFLVEIIFALYLLILRPFITTKFKNEDAFRVIALMILGVELSILTVVSFYV